jgi:hypothetical protein
MSWRGTSGNYKARWTGYRADRRCRALSGQAMPPHYIHPTLLENKRGIKEIKGIGVRFRTPVKTGEQA